MNTRREARETALQALYQCDTLDDWSEDSIALFFERFAPPMPEENALAKSVRLYSLNIIRGVRDNLKLIDRGITSVSQHWSLERMARVDRNLLRLAAYEMRFFPDVPYRVSLNEAIEIAKKFGNADSPRFVNGVLDKLAMQIADDPSVSKHEQCQEGRKKAINA